MNPNNSAFLKDVVTALDEVGGDRDLSSRRELDEAGETETAAAHVEEIDDNGSAWLGLDAGLYVPAWNSRMAALVDGALVRLEIVKFVTDGHEIWFVA